MPADRDDPCERGLQNDAAGPPSALEQRLLERVAGLEQALAEQAASHEVRWQALERLLEARLTVPKLRSDAEDRASLLRRIEALEERLQQHESVY